MNWGDVIFNIYSSHFTKNKSIFPHPEEIGYVLNHRKNIIGPTEGTPFPSGNVQIQI